MEMLRQPGFAVIAVYSAWTYAQVVLIILFLGSLTSKLYSLRSPLVGISVASLALGALLAVPFEKSNIFSKPRVQQLDAIRTVMDKKIAWSSHLFRRAAFTALLPVAGACYASVSSGPPMPIAIPVLFSVCLGFLSCLAVAECNGMIMETFDTSDLSPGMTGRHVGASANDQRRTNYSSFPRVTAGFAIIHTLAYIFAAGSTALAGIVTRTLGQQVATGVWAAILFGLTVGLVIVLVRFKDVQIVPNSKAQEMDRIVEARRNSTMRRKSMPNDLDILMEEENAWKPALVGNPVGKERRMNIFELGSLTRWQEICRENKLIDEGIRNNRSPWDQEYDITNDHVSDLRRDAQDIFHRTSARGRSNKYAHRSDTDQSSVGEAQIDSMSGAAATGAAASPAQFGERECIMSQTVAEEIEEDGNELRRRH